MTPKELIAKVPDLRPTSPAALRLVNVLGQFSVGNDEVVKIIKYDSVLTAKLLRVCNSAFFGLRHPVASVDHAVLILGSQEILSIVLALAYGGTMTTALPGYDFDANDLWQHSLMTATAAEIAVTSGLPLNGIPSVAFTVGLLHDIGKRVIGQAVPVELHNKVREEIKTNNLSRSEAEKKVLGTDHAEVGGVLLHDWRLPEAIVEAVTNHHRPVLKPHPQLSVVAHLANCLAHLVGSAPGSEAYATRVAAHVTETLGLTEEKLEGLLATTHKACERMDQFMQALNAPDPNAPGAAKK